MRVSRGRRCGGWRGRRCGRPRPGPAGASGPRTCRSCSGAPVSSNTKLSAVVSMTRARKMSATRSASTRSAPAPFDLRPAPARAPPPPGRRRRPATLRDLHHPLELRLDLRQDAGRAAGDDGDARGVGRVVGLGHRQALDIVAARGEQADHAVQHARLVVHDHGEGGALGRPPPARRGRPKRGSAIRPAPARASSITEPMSTPSRRRLVGQDHVVVRLAGRDHRETVLGPASRGSRTARGRACRSSAAIAASSSAGSRTRRPIAP